MTTETKIIGGIGAVTMAILAVGVIFLSRTPAQNIEQPLDESQKAKLILADSHQTAKDSGKLEIVEFSDFQCPACGQVYPHVNRIKEEYKDNINFVYRHFPLSQHKNAENAAIASEAASQQSKFWEMHDRLFETQEDWSELGNPKDFYVNLAKEIGLDVDKFIESYDQKINLDKIRADVADGSSLGVNSTPTFFINGVKYKGGLTFEQFKQILDPLLTTPAPSASPSASVSPEPEVSI
jgi:protein-disulfide isomerase